MIKKLLLLTAALYLALSGPARLAAQTGLNGTDARPFYVMAHNPNTIEDVDDALQAGANALEPDLNILPAGSVAGIPCNPPPGLCFEDNPDGIVVYHDHFALTTRIPTTLENFLDDLHQRAVDNPQLALIFFDVKPSVAELPNGPANGLKILTEIRNRLNTDGVNLNIIINVGSRDDRHLFDLIMPMLGEREGVQIDGEDNAEETNAFLLQAAHENIGYGDGTIGPGPNLPRAVDFASFLKYSRGIPKVISDIFTIQLEDSMSFLIDAGADGIIPDISDPVAPESTDIAGYVAKLKNNVMPHHPEIRMATREDNPFKPALQGYGVEVHTMDTGGGGTDAPLTFTLEGCRGTASVTVRTGLAPNGLGTGRMERGGTDHVTISSLNLGKLTKLHIFNDGGLLNFGPWDLQDVAVSSARWLGEDRFANAEYRATWNKTIDSDTTAHIDLAPAAPFQEPPPTIQCPAPITVNNAPGQCNAVVNFGITADGMCPDIKIVSTPKSGTAFDVGTTLVNSTATSAAVNGSASCSFNVTVKDVESPVIACPGPMTVDATGPLGVVVTFAPVVADNCSATTTSVPSSGSVFAIGTTAVNSTAQDPSGNQSTCGFTVHVKGAAEQLADFVTAVNGLAANAGTKNSLLAKLNAALAKVSDPNNGAACGELAAFINEVTAKRGNGISTIDADALIAKATQIRAVLGC